MITIKLKIMVSIPNQLRLLLLVAIGLFSAHSGFSQFDFKHYLPPVWDNANPAKKEPSELFITTPYPSANVHVETADGTTFVFDGVVSSGNPLIISLPIYLVITANENTATNNVGLIITATAPIQACHINASAYNQNLLTLKGRNGVGQNFWTGSQTKNDSGNNDNDKLHFVSVMALENNTSVTITTPFVMQGQASNVVNFVLQKHQSYIIVSDDPEKHVTGGQVTSNKPIVVNSGATHSHIKNSPGADGGTDQLVPYDLLGSQHIVTRGLNLDGYDYANVVATEDNTSIFINGDITPVATLNKGQFYTHILTGTLGDPAFIFSGGKKVAVFHTGGASTQDGPGMALVPNLSCTGTKYVEFAKFTNFTDNQIAIIQQKNLETSNLTLNGVPYTSIPGLIIKPVPGKPSFTCVTFPLSTLSDDNVFKADELFHMAFITGFGPDKGTYGFMSDYDAIFFTDPVTGLPATIYTLQDTLCAGEILDHCIYVESCGTDHNITGYTGNEGSIVLTPVTSPYDTCFSYTAPFGWSGMDTITFTISNEFGYAGDIDIVIPVLDPTRPVDAGPNQNLCSLAPSITLSAVNPDPMAPGTWTVASGGATITNPNNPTTTATNLSLGENLFVWTQHYGCQDASDVTRVFIFNGNAPVADAGEDYSTCSDNNAYTLQANDPGFTAIGTWEVLEGTAFIFDINDPNSSITNLGIGENILEWNIDNGPCPGDITKDQVSIFVYDENHAVANAGADKVFCTAGFTSTTLSGTALIAPATCLWEVVSGSAIINNPNVPNVIVTNLGIGENILRYTITNGPCGSTSDEVKITLYNNTLATPNAGPDAAYCLPTNSHALSANSYVLPAQGTWSVITGSGAFSNIHDPNATVSNLAFGTNTFAWTLSNGPCVNTGNSDQITVTIFSGSQAAASAGPDQEWCTDSFVSANITANSATLPATGQWTVIAGTGSFANALVPNTSVTGLSNGLNTFRWTINNGPCGTPTTDDLNITLYDATVESADAGTDIDLCTPVGNVPLSANTVSYPAVGTWSFVTGSGTFDNVNDPNTQVAGLGVGTYELQWSINNGVCAGPSDTDQMTITIYDQFAPVSDAGENQLICSNPLGSTDANLQANAATAPGIGTWSLIQGSGNISDINNPNTAVTGLDLGENIFQWEINNGPCAAPTVSQVSVIVYPASQAIADAGTDQNLCGDNPNTSLAGSNYQFPSEGTWSLISGAGTIADDSDPSSAVTSLAIGDNVFQWTVDNGPCGGSTSDLVTIRVYPNLQADADAGNDQVACTLNAIKNLNASSVQFPSTGLWSVIQGSASFSNVNIPNPTVSGFTQGINRLVWTVDNGACNGITADTLMIAAFDPGNELPANAGPNQFLCAPTNSTQLAGNPTSAPTQGTWTLIQGTGTFVNPAEHNTIVNNLSLGENIFEWKHDKGICGSSTDRVSIFVYDNNQPAADAGADQSICTPINFATMSANAPAFPATGQWTLVQGTATFANPSSPSTLVNGLSVGENILQWTINNGPCANPITTDVVSIFVYDELSPDANAGPDQFFCSNIAAPIATVMAANSPVFPATGEWTLVQGTGIIANPGSPNTDIFGLDVGENIFRWTLTNGNCTGSITTSEVSIFVFPRDQVAANAGADQNLCSNTPSTSLQGNTVTFPASGTWRVIQGFGIINNVNSPTSLVNSLPIGVNTFEWSISNGPCGPITRDTVSITVYPVLQAAANAGPDQSICSSTSSVLLSGNTVQSPAQGTWSVLAGSGSFSNANANNASVSGLSVGDNILQWSISNGPCAAPSTDIMHIYVFDINQADASVGLDQEVCSSNPSVVLSGNALTYPATGSWNLISGSGIIDNPTDPQSTVSNLGVGENLFEWTISNGPCGNSVSATLTVTVYFTTQAPAIAGPDQNICSDLPSTNLAGNAPTFPALGTWTLISGSGDIANIHLRNSAVTNLGVGENIFEWSINNGVCASPTTDLVSIFVYDNNLPAANAGVDQFLCTPNTISNLAATSPTFPATGNWSLVSGSGLIITPNDPNSLVSGLSVGANIFKWTVTNGPCSPSSSSDQMTIFMYDENAPAAQTGSDIDVCTPVSAVVISANAPVYPGTGLWTRISGTGAVVNPTNPSSNVTGLTVGVHEFEWTLTNGPCANSVTKDRILVTVYNEFQPIADAGPDQSFCTPQSTANMAGSSVDFPAIGTWKLISGTGTFSDINDPNTQVANLSIGENIFEYTVSNGPCTPSITVDRVSIFVYDNNAADADAGADQFQCSTSLNSVLNGNAPVGVATGTWTRVSGSGSIAQPNNPSSPVSALAVGENVFRWTINNGGCAGGTTSDEVSIFIYSNSQTPANAGPDQDLCTPIDFAFMAANNVIFPAIGTWSIVSGGGDIEDANNPLTKISNLPVGVNVLQWTINNGSCVNPITSSQMSIVVYDGTAPSANAGDDQELCSPVSSTTLNADPALVPGIGTWTVVSGSGSFADANDPNTTVNGLSAGLNRFAWTLNYGSCGTTQDIVNVVVFNSNLAASDAGANQSICLPNQQVTLAALPVPFPAYGKWTVVGGAGDIADTLNPASIVSNLPVGENIFTWTVYNGGCSDPLLLVDSVSIFVFDNSQSIANAGNDQDFCSPISDASLSANALIFPATGNWSVVQGTGVFADENASNTTVSGLSIGENIFEWRVDNGPCSPGITTDQLSIIIYDDNAPDADAGSDQSQCTPDLSTVLSANSPVGAAVGTWTLVSGSGSFVNANDPNTQVNALSVGENVFRWTIDNGGCAGGTTSSDVSVFIYLDSQADAYAGADQDLCTPQLSTFLNGNTLTYPATGSWTLISGSGILADANDPKTEVTGLNIGLNVFEWVIDNGPCANSVTADQVTIAVFDGGAPPANAGVEQELCAPISSTFMTAVPAVSPGTGTWTVLQGNGVFADPNDPLTELTGLTIGVNRFKWTLDYSTCGTEEASVDIIVYDSNLPDAYAGTDQSFCLPQNSTTMTADAVAGPAYGTWSLVSGSGTFSNANDPNTLVSNLAIGENVFAWNIYNGSCGAGNYSDLVSIYVFDNAQLPANAGADQDFCSPTDAATLNGNNLTFPAVGQWTLSAGSGVFDDENDPKTGVSGLSVGENIFTWNITNGACPGGNTQDDVSIFIYDQNQSDAAAGPDQNLCTPISSTTLAANAITFPAVGTWTKIAGQGIIADANDPNTGISGLTVGLNTFRWTIYNGPCKSPSSDEVNIYVFDGNSADAAAGADQELCTPTLATALDANAVVYPAVGSWTRILGTGNIIAPSNPTSLVNNLGIGINRFVWTIDNGPCSNGITRDTVDVVLYDFSAPKANAGADQAFCTPVSSTAMTALVPAIPGLGTWSLIQGSGDIDDANDPSTGIQNLNVGENIFEWSVYNGPCAAPSVDRVSIYIFDENSASADAGADQQLCAPVSSTALDGSVPTFPSIGTWTLINGSGTFADIHDPKTTVDDLSIGENIFEWTVNNGPCANGNTSAKVSIFLYDNAQADADAGADQFYCSPTANTDLDANAVIFPATGKWTLINGTGVFANDTDPLTNVSGLTVGENQFVWSITNGNCPDGFTSDTVSVFIYDENQAAANAGADIDICSPNSQVTLGANAPIFPAKGSWLRIAGTGVPTDVNDPNTTITGLQVGVSTFRWTMDNGPCSAPTTDVVVIQVFDENNADANAGPDQEICTSTGFTDTNLSGNALVFPSTGSWSLIEGGGDFADNTDPNTSVNNIPVGINRFVWSVDNGPCANSLTSDTVTVFVFDNNTALAAAGADQSHCTPTSAVTMDALVPTVPEIGEWTLVNGPNVPVIADVNDPKTDIDGLQVGLYTFQWSVYRGPCAPGSSFDLVSIYIYDENQLDANAGADQSLCTPQTSTALEGNAVTFPAVGTWTLISGTANISDENNPATAVSNLAVGNNVFVWTLMNGPCGNPMTTDTVIVSLFNFNAADADAGEDQFLCFDLSNPTNSLLTGNSISAPSTGLWTLESGSANISDPTASTTAITDLQVGEHVFKWTINNGPCGFSEDFVTIQVFDPVNPLADAGDDQELCTPLSATTMTGSPVTFPAAGYWHLESGTGVLADSTAYNSAVNNLDIGTNVFVWHVNNGPCNPLSTDTMEIRIFDQNADLAYAGEDQELCANGTLVSTILEADTITNPTTGIWTLYAGGGNITDPTSNLTAITDMPVGENIFIWSIYNGPCGSSADTLSVFVYDASNELADAGGDQELCSPQSDSNLDGNTPIFPAYGTWVLLSGNAVIADINDPKTNISGLNVGQHIFEWRVYNGPCGPISTDEVIIDVFDQNNLAADAGADIELCTPVDSTYMAAITPVFPASGNWTLISGSADIANATDPNTAIGQLGIGENQFVWTVYNGPCPPSWSNDTISIFLYDANAALADAGSDQEICSPMDVVLMDAAVPADPGVGTWSVIAGSGTFAEPNNPKSSVSGLSIGVNTYRWTLYNGPCVASGSVDEVNIYKYDENQADADAGADQQWCTPKTTSVMSASDVVYPGSGIWKLIQGQGVISDPTDAQSLVSGLAVGDNLFTWTVLNGPCGNAMTTDTVKIAIYDSTAPDANAGANQELCLPITTAALQGNSPVGSAIGTWTLISGSGTLADINDPGSLVSGLAQGNNEFEWTIDNGACGSSSDRVIISVFNPDAPLADAGNTQNYCTPTSTAILSGNTAEYPAVGTWTKISGSGTISDKNDPNALVSGLTTGENIFQWRIHNGNCEGTESVDYVSIFIFDKNAPEADAGADQETCLPDDFADMTANEAIFPAIGTWTLIEGFGNIADLNDPTTRINNLALGNNLFVWTIDNGPCATGISQDTIAVFVFENNPEAPYAGADQSFCSPTASTVLDANLVNAPNEGTWSIIQGSGFISDVHDPKSLISGLGVGTNHLLWSVYNGPCAEAAFADTVSIFIFDANQEAANAGEDQELCLPSSTTLLNGNMANDPAVGTWTLVSGSANILNPNDPNTVITGMTLGTNSFAWTINNGPCAEAITSDTVEVRIFDNASALADAGENIEICTPESCVQLDALLPVDPNVGTWTLLNGSASIADINDAKSEVCALPVGIHTLRWSVYNGPCTNGSSSDEMTITVYNQNAAPAAAGDDINLCWPEDSVRVAAEVPLYPALGTWEILSGQATISDIHDPSAAFTAMQIGILELKWTVYNGPCADATEDFMTIKINDPNSPDADAGEDQYFCSPEEGTAMNAMTPIFPAVGTWTISSGDAQIGDINDPLSPVDNMQLGQTQFIWTVDNGSCANGVTQDGMSIFVNDINVAKADAGADQFFCGVADSTRMQASVTIGNTASGQWQIIEGGGTFANDKNEKSWVFNVPIGVNRYVWIVDNLECGISSDTLSVFVFDPNQEDPSTPDGGSICENEFDPFMLNAPAAVDPATGYWTILDDSAIELSDLYDPNAVVLSLGEITQPFDTVVSHLTWTILNGPCWTLSDTIEFRLEDCLSLKIPDAFSPNGDGVNDDWVIPNLDSYPNNAVQIFNRWGAEVFNAAPYKNNWDGRSNHSATIGEELPVSTYYYVLDIGDGRAPFTGYIYLKR